ncbi:NAD(P)H-hydrate epimerase [Singulisphaera sp. GP187]|uniref:NAD(P)H-hydrate epimerase n=1 Tax=Singulisphaera sp. GP187 TaxID=1882752 RepID=UPI000925EB9E|nr:NAD(P)H-hydrate epimerase [Singulisphaera sp. GP187]SIO33042.1 NAD(P)H-hydrate epimerase [Singulisphaera sp. GP187]
MAIRPLTREEVRSLDARAVQELGLPTLVLMENAGRGAAAWLRDQGVGPATRVLIVCGPGNNGGDGGVVARHLDAGGVSVRVVWFAQAGQLRGDAAVQHDVLARSGIEQTYWESSGSDDADRLGTLIAEADWVVDALLGTGLTRPVEGILYAAITAINRSGKPVLALDLPSGLDADRGQALGEAVRARATATFVAPKLGFSAPGAIDFTGEVFVVAIGVPRCLLEPFEADPRT